MHLSEIWKKYWARLLALLLVFIGLLVLGLRLWSFVFSPPTPPETLVALSIATQEGDLFTMPELDRATATPVPKDERIVVYITGAVVRPDTYELPKNARVKDAVLAAGGLTGDAASERVNLAATLADAQHIHVPRISETTSSTADSPVDQASAGAAAGSQVDINSASAAELEDLPGIGQTLAERIIAYRTANGPFSSVDDLAKVPGVGTKLLEDLRPLISASS